MKDTHKTHRQWAISYQSPKGRKQRWAGGDSATTYHTLSENENETCTYWIQERICYRADYTELAPTPAQWEQSVRKFGEQIKKVCEKQWEDSHHAGMSDKAKGKQRAEAEELQ